MAFDTENKRRSALGVPGVIRILPSPDDSLDPADRAHLFVYSGLDYSQAIATGEQDRRSILGVPAVIRVLPAPDGAIDQYDRAHLFLYRGLDYSAVAGGRPDVDITELMVYGAPGPVRVVEEVPLPLLHQIWMTAGASILWAVTTLGLWALGESLVQ